MIRLLAGDCRDVLATLPAESVQCVVTSPPYYGLRDYGTALWDGGDAACDHKPDARCRSAKSTLDQGAEYSAMTFSAYRGVCGKCGAVRVDRQIGLEATPDEYLATMVGVFREVRRVLRADGTCWVNMGSSYSTGKGSNVTDQLNRLLEGGLVFYTDAGSVAVAGHSVGVSSHHEGAPDSELPGFFAAERNGVEQRDQNLCKVIDLLACPGSVGAGPAVLGVITNTSDPEMALDKGKHGTVVPAELNAQAEAILAVLGPSGAGARENDEAALAIHETDEPSVRGNVRWHTAWHTFAAEAIRKGLEDVHLVDDAIALGNRLNTLTGLLRDFRVAKASEKQITLTSIHGGLSLAISDVGHLWFVLRCGSIIPYSRLYADASRCANALLPKQDIGMPWRLARALQEDGWILRSPIIWHKPNPMPESCRDRPTSAHEHVFLLTRSARYFYDADAVREEAEYGASIARDGAPRGPFQREAAGGGFINGSRAPGNGGSRNLRNVWSIATSPYPNAHFATYPAELAERCIKAGTSERGCCAACGKPWGRTTETTRGVQPGSWHDHVGDQERGQRGGASGYRGADRKAYDNGYSVTTTGWSPGCQCNAGDPVPCVVLDCFAGAGTTLLVADRLQRDAIGIELNTAYTEMAMERCRADAPLFTAFPPAEDPEETRMADLFTDMAAD